jgi:transposase-like protein
VYDASTRSAAIRRIESGDSLRAIARDTGINRSTLREWRERRGAFARRYECPCPNCGTAPLPPAAYLYLLGQYLGDGCISQTSRTCVLRIATCDSYPGIRAEVVAAINQLVASRVHFVSSDGCIYVQAVTQQWLHLFPQHGPGLKHDRPIVLAPWQLAMVDEDPRPLLRGLIHSDGWRGANWTSRTVGGTTKRYTYPRYQFSNRSADIRRIFTDALDRLDIPWRQSNQWTISVARRQAVAALDEFVGPKF